MEILRNLTNEELTGDVNSDTSPAFVPIALPSGKVETIKDKFNKRINQEEQKAMSEGKPFAIWAVRADIKDIQDDFAKRFKRQGYVKGFKIPTLDEINWKKYSDLKNWELITEDKVRDPQLSKEHKVSIYLKRRKYRYKGYSNTYSVMEDSDEALTRALDALEERRVRKEK